MGTSLLIKFLVINYWRKIVRWSKYNSDNSLIASQIFCPLNKCVIQPILWASHGLSPEIPPPKKSGKHFPCSKKKLKKEKEMEASKSDFECVWIWDYLWSFFSKKKYNIIAYFLREIKNKKKIYLWYK